MSSPAPEWVFPNLVAAPGIWLRSWAAAFAGIPQLGYETLGPLIPFMGDAPASSYSLFEAGLIDANRMAGDGLEQATGFRGRRALEKALKNARVNHDKALEQLRQGIDLEQMAANSNYPAAATGALAGFMGQIQRGELSGEVLGIRAADFLSQVTVGYAYSEDSLAYRVLDRAMGPQGRAVADQLASVLMNIPEFVQVNHYFNPADFHLLYVPPATDALAGEKLSIHNQPTAPGNPLPIDPNDEHSNLPNVPYWVTYAGPVPDTLDPVYVEYMYGAQAAADSANNPDQLPPPICTAQVFGTNAGDEDALGWNVWQVMDVVRPNPARVFNVMTANDWVSLVSRFPALVGGQDRSVHYVEDTGAPGPWVVPNWDALRQNFDVVHLSARAVLECSYAALPVLVGTEQYYTTLSWYTPGCTLWFIPPGTQVNLIDPWSL